ncbi:MAG: transcriptional repressor [Lachnospiraceae bacterium]|nr:transcriptional repressor [Lachnospiraceae bacterium]
MAQLKYSRQRESIKDYLYSTTEHPTAEMVYKNVRKVYPNISLGTVYRNLNLLVAIGDIIRLDCGDGFERFDGKTSTHYHFICRECGRVWDMDIPQFENIGNMVPDNIGGVIEGHSAYFYGKCDECIKKGLTEKEA